MFYSTSFINRYFFAFRHFHFMCFDFSSSTKYFETYKPSFTPFTDSYLPFWWDHIFIQLILTQTLLIKCIFLFCTIFVSDTFCPTPWLKIDGIDPIFYFLGNYFFLVFVRSFIATLIKYSTLIHFKAIIISCQTH